LGLKFPNLPYLIDGDTKVTESIAILKYLARRFNREDLLGKTLEDYALVETYLGVINDIQVTFIPLLPSDDWKNQLEPTWNQIKPKLELLEKNVVNETALGYLTIVDVKLATLLRLLFAAFKGKEQEYKKLFALRDHIYGLPQVRKYL